MKRLLLIPAVLILIYLGWIFYLALSFRPLENKEQGLSGLEIRGVFHIHTQFSDGRKPVDKVIDYASRKPLDFLVLTDHGSPNVPSMSSQGWRKGVLVLAGSEVSVNRGHLVALDFKMPSGRFPQNAEQTSYQVKKLGGFTVISHPFSKVSWSWGREGEYSGLEIVNADTMLRTDILKSLPYFPAALIKPSFVLLKIMDRPSKNLRKWDQLNREGPAYGYFSADAHLLYKPLFSFLLVHVLLDRPLSSDFREASQQVFGALRSGRFYNAVDAAAQADGFRFFGRSGRQIIPMGSQVSLGKDMTLLVKTPFSFKKEIRLIRDGDVFLVSSENDVVFQPSVGGVYRVEVYLKERSPLAEDVPWIVSNPIFIGKDE